MGVYKGLAGIGRGIVAVILAGALSLGVFGCAKPTAPKALLTEPTTQPNRLSGPMEEVSPPETLQTLKQIVDAYDPQVRILSPRPGEVVESTTVSVRFQVRGLPIFKDPKWELGPHLHVFLDDEPYRAVYDLTEPLMLSDLAPGTHTLRVFASRPWHESFKNQGAFDQRTFHIFAQTPQKALDKNQPLLTYSRPQGSYGAEPIMLDFYLTNAPLHAIAQENSQDSISDWRIRCTVNGQSFVFDQWQPVYLKGFKPGQNWVQLELIDENGELIDNAFNNTVRVINYEPGGEDTLSQLVRDELSLQTVAGIIDPTYIAPEETAPGIAPPAIESAEPESLPELLPEAGEPEPAPAPAVLPPTAEEEPSIEAPSIEELPKEEPLEREPMPQVEEPAPEVKALEEPVEEEPALKELIPEENALEDLASEELAPAPEVEAEPAEPLLPDQTVPILPAPIDLPQILEPPLTDSKPVPDVLEGLPEAEQPLSPPPQIPDVLDSAPTSSRFFKDFKQWRQQHQQPKVPPEMAPSSGLRELPDALSVPVPDPEVEPLPLPPDNSLESPAQILPEIVVPPDSKDIGEPLDLVEPEPQIDKPDQPDRARPTPASPEQLFI
ncbi:hypothetical protein [Pseudanabaena sp. FACHB-2040]|uniref:hypothetical protein n=1 Tax=Pseudanabaena sp. FACHB-2040 TaxID=2692859 RepID=UPI001682CDF4|nr:hypothetical protein [Pseudanabaena sp. FACHB-2040]MBD2260565.1 hypothetical protein [Pseudanabaena sp. FACHB-2040]